MSKHTKAGRRASFREHCTGSKRRQAREDREIRRTTLRWFGPGRYIVQRVVQL